MEFASPRKVVMNVAVLAGVFAIASYVSPLTFDMVIEQAVAHPLLTAVVAFILLIFILKEPSDRPSFDIGP